MDPGLMELGPRVPGLRDPGPRVPGLRDPGPRVPGLRDLGPGSQGIVALNVCDWILRSGIVALNWILASL